jgi:putative FmdB family regulatory protein
MPIFEYTCSKCGKTFEKLILGRNPQPPECPHCGAKEVTQQFSTFSSAVAGAKSSRGACAPSGGG